MSMWTAEALYGSPPLPEPASAGTVGPATSSAQAADGVRATPAAGAGGILTSPVFWLVALVAGAFGLIGFSVRVGK